MRATVFFVNILVMVGAAAKLTTPSTDYMCAMPPPIAAVPLKGTAASLFQKMIHQVDNTLKTLAEPLNGGFTVAIVLNNSTALLSGYGEANPTAPGVPPSPQNSIFRVGSITKVFTSLWMMQLLDEGIISLDDPLVKHMPGFSMQMKSFCR